MKLLHIYIPKKSLKQGYYHILAIPIWIDSVNLISKVPTFCGTDAIFLCHFLFPLKITPLSLLNIFVSVVYEWYK